MDDELRRMQVLLGSRQQQALADLAEARRTSVSALLREAVACYLAEAQVADARRQAFEALEALQRQRVEIEARQGVYYGDLVSEAREERDSQIASAVGES